MAKAKLQPEDDVPVSGGAKRRQLGTLVESFAPAPMNRGVLLPLAIIAAIVGLGTGVAGFMNRDAGWGTPALGAGAVLFLAGIALVVFLSTTPRRS